MQAMDEEHELLINPVVQESVLHNTKTISDLRSLLSSLLGIAAGTLGLESYAGFIFYFVMSAFTSLLMGVFLAGGKPKEYFRGGWWDLLSSELIGGLAGYVLTWTLFLGLVGV
ncbi:Rab5-interacting protein-domain-containing protein [Terfezia claveryi]|nr:Rab5-interacting protein-domain-containing protein [Terfezia claveryi]